MASHPEKPYPEEPFPAEPWQLRGQLHAAAFLVPLADVPLDLPPGCSPVRVGRFGIVGAAWVVYEPGGVLDYRELMATVLVRRGARLLPTIPAIWVDSAASRDGGRALWGIPKELATFEALDADGADARFAARDEHGPIATGRVRRVLALPGRWPVSFSIAQWLGGAAKVSPVHARAGLALARARLQADPGGRLGFLSGRRPFAAFTMRDFRMSFGAATPGADASGPSTRTHSGAAGRRGVEWSR